MSQAALLIIKYKYLILFPLAAIEGPVVALAAGFLVFAGYLDFLPAYAIMLLGDLIPDTFYYYIGRFGHKKELIIKYSYLKIISRHFSALEHLWAKHGLKTMFLSKLAYGLSTPLLISAGLVKMPLRRFISYAFPVTVTQYGIIMVIGFSLGHSYQTADKYIHNASIFIAAILVLLVVAYIIIGKYASRQISKIEKENKK